jgi:hypothetical protein
LLFGQRWWSALLQQQSLLLAELVLSSLSVAKVNYFIMLDDYLS